MKHKPSKDPYAALGVPKDATTQQVKRAYRKKAVESHPDKGGDAQQFALVAEAYALLSDPGKRAHYDATGTAPESIEQRSLQMAVECLLFMCARLDTKHEDVVQACVERIKQLARDQAVQVKEARKKAAVFRDAAARVTAKAGGNLLASALENQAAGFERNAAACEEQGRVMDAAAELLAGYDYKVDAWKDNASYGSIKVEIAPGSFWSRIP